jgi:hypothetical protein
MNPNERRRLREQGIGKRKMAQRGYFSWLWFYKKGGVIGVILAMLLAFSYVAEVSLMKTVLSGLDIVPLDSTVEAEDGFTTFLYLLYYLIAFHIGAMLQALYIKIRYWRLFV